MGFNRNGPYSLTYTTNKMIFFCSFFMKKIKIIISLINIIFNNVGSEEVYCHIRRQCLHFDEQYPQPHFTVSNYHNRRRFGVT